MQWVSQVTFAASLREKEEPQEHGEVQKRVMQLRQSLHQGKGGRKKFWDAKRGLILSHGLAGFLYAVK